MRYTILTVAAAAIVAVHAQDSPCQDAYKKCIAAGTAEVACSCTLTACLGEDDLRNREYCSSATANLPSSTSSIPIITGTAGSQPSGQPAITAAEGSLQLGETCSDDKQCANGVKCWGSNAGIIRRCGNFNAECSSDAQCAYNTCTNGLCAGFLASSEYPANTVSKTSAPGSFSTSWSTSFSTSSGYAFSTSVAFACNPAHEYPEGQQCVSINGGLTLVPAATASTTYASSATSIGFACNPAHEYPEGQQCVSTNGGLTLIPAATTTAGPASIATAPFVPTYGAGNGTTGVAPSGTGAMVPSGTGIVPYTGAASVVGVFSGVIAVAAGALAFVL